MALNNTEYRWFFVPIEVKGIPVNIEFAPVSFYIDFEAILESLGESGVFDERTLEFYHVKPDGSEVEEPVQFSPDVQPRYPKQHLWPATETPSTLNVSGKLTWIVRGESNGVRRYRLLFGIPNDGGFVQVPFLPNNLRHFHDDARATPARWFPRMQIRPQWPLDGVVNILRDGELMTTYHIGPTDNAASAVRRPYFYPVNGPDGIGLTELGKPHDPTGSHAHHYSLWIAHANVGGSDFWSERGGRIRHEQFELMEDGPIFARLVQRTRWEKREPDTASLSLHLCERRQLTFYATPADFSLIDIDLELSPGETHAASTLEETPFGFLAARVAQSMTVFDGGGEIINSLGQRNEQKAHWQRAAWIDQSGPVTPEKWGGIALFDHPNNPGHPTFWHCRNDGWAGASFNFNRAWNIEPDNPLQLRYRVHFHRHDASAGKVARRYDEYACKPDIRPGTPRSLAP